MRPRTLACRRRARQLQSSSLALSVEVPGAYQRASIADPPRNGLSGVGTRLGSPRAVHVLRHVPNGYVMPKPIASILVGLLSCTSLGAAEPALLLPCVVGVPEKNPARRPLALEALREQIRIASRDGSLQTAAQQSPAEDKSWMKRHPVWF